MVQILIGTFVIIGFAIPCLAQDLPKIQAKPVFHAPVAAEPGWYPAAWSITNIRQGATDNTNIMLGLGRKIEKGWVEVMAMRQYSIHTNQWFVDFRFSHQLPKKFSTFIEISPFLGTRALYTFGRLEYSVSRRFNIVVIESENVHKTGADSWGMGPGVSMKPMKFIGPMRFAPVVVWQMRPNDPDFLRFYLGFPF